MPVSVPVVTPVVNSNAQGGLHSTLHAVSSRQHMTSTEWTVFADTVFMAEASKQQARVDEAALAHAASAIQQDEHPSTGTFSGNPRSDDLFYRAFTAPGHKTARANMFRVLFHSVDVDHRFDLLLPLLSSLPTR